MIAEDLLLLALNDEKGSIHVSASSALPYGLSGAILVELTLKDRLALHEQKVIVIDEQPTGDTLLDTTLSLIQSNPKRKSAKYWVNQLDSKIGKIKNKLFTTLVAKEVVAKNQKKFLGIFPYTTYPLIAIEEKRKIVHRVRQQVLDSENEPDDATAVLGSLLYPCNLTNHVFLPEDRKAAKSRMKKLIKSEAYGKAVSDAVQAMQAAVMLACISAATISTTSSSSSS